MDACAGRLRAVEFGGLVVCSDYVKRGRLKWFGLVWGCQEKERRIRSKKGGKVASAWCQGVELPGRPCEGMPPRDDGVTDERKVVPPIADFGPTTLVRRDPCDGLSRADSSGR